MSTHNICFRGEIRKIIYQHFSDEKSALSVVINARFAFLKIYIFLIS